MEKILTVSIAAYNVEKFIKKTLDSFVQPEIMDAIEVFVIDDGGRDNSLSIARNYAEKYPKTFFPVHKENGGWGSTVNYAMEHASGKYFKILDGDDWFEKDNLVDFIDLLKVVDTDIVYTPYILVDSETENPISTVGEVNESYCGQIIEMSEASKMLDFAMHNMTVKSKLLRENKVKLLEHCFYTDTEFFIKSVANSKNVYVDDKAIYCYRVGREGQSVSLTGLKKHFDEWEKVCSTLLSYYSNLETSKRCLIEAGVKTYLVTYGYTAYLKMGMLEGIKKFDDMIKRQYPELYPTDVRKIRLLLLTGFSGVVFKLLVKRELNKI